MYTVLGGIYEPYTITIDKILIRSQFRPSIAVANKFSGPELRVFLAGDAAHQNIPTGGYGMNTGLADAYDIGWKLAAVVKGYGGLELLKSYEQERNPTASQSVQRSGVHMGVHMTAVELLGERGPQIDSPDGAELRHSLEQHYQRNNGENTDMGIEMGYRYVSAICIPDKSGVEPTWDPHTYIPTTWPGSRAPHLFLKDGTSILDHLGPEFTLVEFDEELRPPSGSDLIVEAAQALGLPLVHARFHGEDEAARIWEKPLVLVRPDGHVAWRDTMVGDRPYAEFIIRTAAGQE